MNRFNPCPSSTYNFDLSENVAYIHPSFPVYVKKAVLSSYPDYSAMSHWHEDWEFIVILSGSMIYHVNGNLIELSTGDGRSEERRVAKACATMRGSRSRGSYENE